MKNTTRQIKDIGAQANRILNYNVSIEDIYSFGKYSNELKVYLLNTVKDEFTLKHIREIPDLLAELEKQSTKENFINAVLTVLFSVTTYFTKDNRAINKAKPIVREIQGKYASIEFLLGNN